MKFTIEETTPLKNAVIEDGIFSKAVVMADMAFVMA